MLRRSVLVLVVCVVPSLLEAQNGSTSCAYKSLVETEYAFAGDAASSGIRSAFLRYLSDDAVVFRPDPKPGRQTYIEWKETGAWLQWAPQFAGVSSAGDLGFTSGPWEYRNGPNRPVVARGHFVSVWKKDPGGSWRLAADIGTSCVSKEQDDTLIVPASCDSLATLTRAWGFETTRGQEVRAMDSLFGIGKSFNAGSTFDSLIVAAREGSLPASGVEAALRWYGKGSKGVCVPLFVGVASSGDLAYTYGEKRVVKKGRCSYLHIWKKPDGEGRWKLVVIVEGGMHR